MNTPRVAFCGAIANRSGPARGGVELGTRSIIDELERRGIEVIEFAYPTPNRYGPRFAKALAYGAGLPLVLLNLLSSARGFDVLHLTSLYRHFIYPELLIVLCTRLLGAKVLLHVRPGDWLLQYERRSSLYRWCFRQVVRASHRVAVEGMEHLDAMRCLPAKAFYLPSFVVDPPRLNPSSQSPSERLRLVFVGALSEEKGLHVALQARRHLQARGIDVSLLVVGQGDTRYVRELQAD